MKAMILNTFGGTENFIIEELPIPQIAKDEVLIQVKAISINPVDAKTRSGRGIAGMLQGIKPLILGWDISGVVVEAGEQVTDFKKGDAVFGMVNFPGYGKTYAEYVTAPASQLALKPSNISHEEAAGATLAALTAWQALVTHAQVKSGQKVLIQAAAGGVGHYAVQIAKYLGAYVTGTSSAINKDFVLSLGADEHIDYQTQNIYKDFDFVLDPIGGDNIERSLEFVKPSGTLITLPSKFKEMVAEKAQARGINGYFFMVLSNGEDMKQIANLLEKGVVKSFISQTFSFDKMTEAHQQIETGKTKGKIVVTL